MKAEILRMLRESTGFVSGQQICDTFGVSRTAVWKVIKQLQEEGYQIEAVRNKGYHITNYPDIVSKEEIKSYLKTRWAGQNLLYYSETDSTNTRAKRLGEDGAPHGTLAVAEQQNAGKGRRGRVWTSPPGTSIYMSILLRPKFGPDKAPMLTLVMACAVARALKEHEDILPKIKWPNDLVLNKKKICGILTEMSAEVDYINHVVIGVGINVNISSFPEELAGKATSLCLECGEQFRRAPLIAKVAEEFERCYEKFEMAGDLSPFLEEYNDILVNRDREVSIVEAGCERSGRALGINNVGELLVEYPDGTVEAVFSGEVSVRGIYGYV